MAKPARKPPFRLISSECDPDSTRCSNILLILPNSAPIGSRFRTRFTANQTTKPGDSNPLLQPEENKDRRLCISRVGSPASLQDTKKLATLTLHASVRHPSPLEARAP